LYRPLARKTRLTDGFSRDFSGSGVSDKESKENKEMSLFIPLSFSHFLLSIME
jgi:hypothetical protein